MNFSSGKLAIGFLVAALVAAGLVLEVIGLELVDQADSKTLLTTQVDHNTLSGLLHRLPRGV